MGWGGDTEKGEAGVLGQREIVEGLERLKLKHLNFILMASRIFECGKDTLNTVL